MKTVTNNIIMILIAFGIMNNIFGQPKKQLVDQKPCVAGQFYPAEPSELRSMIKVFFSKAKPDKKAGEVLAIVSPHAGYVFSGQIAASAFNQIDPEKEYETIFIIGSSHQMLFEGAAIYNVGNFITPLGTVEVNISLADRIIRENSIFLSKTDAFRHEHSLEVQLPFLQFYLKKDFQIVPIIIGTQNPSVSREIAETLLPYFNKKNLFVFSSDFSHYPDYRNAVMVDKQTADAIVSKSPEKFLNTIHTSSDKNIPNLATRICGWTSVLSLLYMAEKIPDAEIHLVDYKNSGDSEYGDKIRVVGYNAMSVTLKTNEDNKIKNFSLSETDKKTLLLIARNTIEYYLTQHKIYDIEPDHLSDILKTPSGAFVTLNKHDNLRGCIGRLSGDTPLYNVVQNMAVAAAVNDYRFDKVNINELKDIEIEISVLSPLKKIKSIEEIELGKHGIYIKKGMQTGTFLPQVASHTKWNKEEFLGHCARDKAMIGWDGWKGAEIFTYEAVVFSEKDTRK